MIKFMKKLFEVVGMLIVGGITILTIILGMKLCVYLYEYLAPFFIVLITVLVLLGGMYYVGWSVVGAYGEIRQDIKDRKRQKKS